MPSDAADQPPWLRCCPSLAAQYVGHMIAQAEIRQLSFPDKAALLETVWVGIATDPGQVEVPQWHKDIFDQRDEGLGAGSLSFSRSQKNAT